MSEMLWTGEELTRALGAPSAPLRSGVGGVSIDTRTLQAGDLFIAIKGDVHDGHDHAARAFEAGAAAMIAEASRSTDFLALGPVFAVEDTLRAMERLGVAARARSKAHIAAVTGSVGKTSAKEMLRTALASGGSVHASAASFNNHWGVPLTLSRLPRGADYAVFEIGMNHAGEITPLVGFVRPQVALITTIAPVHIEHLGSLEAIADAKAEIFSGVEPGGVAVLNAGAPQFERLRAAATARGLNTRTFGAAGDARFLELDLREEGSRVRAMVSGREIAFELGAPGAHMAENALGVLLVCEALGADLAQVAAALGNFAPQKGRGERFALTAKGGAFTVIDESYNANPASMRAALGLLGAATPGEGGRRIAVLGDMLELGAFGPDMHASLALDLVASHVDCLFGVGPLTRRLYDAAPAAMRAGWGGSSAEIREALVASMRARDPRTLCGTAS